MRVKPVGVYASQWLQTVSEVRVSQHPLNSLIVGQGALWKDEQRSAQLSQAQAVQQTCCLEGLAMHVAPAAAPVRVLP